MKHLTQSISGVVGSLFLFLCMPVIAQNAVADCQFEIDRAKAARPAAFTPGEIDMDARHLAGASCSQLDALRASLARHEQTLRQSPGSEMEKGPMAHERMAACIQRALINRCTGSASNQGSSPKSTPSGNTSNLPALQQADAVRLADIQKADADLVRQKKFKRQIEKAQADAALALAGAKDTQELFDEGRRGKPKRHHPGGEAHQCLSLKKAGLYGGFDNSCAFPVSYFFCHSQPKKDSWGESLDCAKNKIGMGRVQPKTGAAEHTYNSVMVYWFACKEGFHPVDSEFVSGQGLRGRCAS